MFHVYKQTHILIAIQKFVVLYGKMVSIGFYPQHCTPTISCPFFSGTQFALHYHLDNLDWRAFFRVHLHLTDFATHIYTLLPAF